MRLSLRDRLLSSALSAVLVTGATTVIVAVWMIGDTIVGQAQEKVRLDLNSARLVYEGVLADVRKGVDHTAVRFFLREALATGDVGRAAEELGNVRRRDYRCDGIGRMPS